MNGFFQISSLLSGLKRRKESFTAVDAEYSFAYNAPDESVSGGARGGFADISGKIAVLAKLAGGRIVKINVSRLAGIEL